MQSKLDELKAYISSFDGLAIAYSGGVDSTLLLKVCHDILGDKCVAINCILDASPDSDIRIAKSFCESEGINYYELSINIFDNPDIVANRPDRCYHCKKQIFTGIIEKARELGFNVVAEGTNNNDLSDYRPGLRAIKELGVLSPLAKFELTKPEIRAISADLKLPTSGIPSTPCLATRIPYNEVITRDKLSVIRSAEAKLRSLGLSNYRVRLHNDVARIEVLPEQFDIVLNNRDNITAYFQSLGITYTSLDLTGFSSGSMNKSLTPLERNMNL